MGLGLSHAPWATNGDCGDESVLDADGYMVADCAIFGASKKRGGDNVANARAIAALPELLTYIRSSAEAGCATAAALLASCDMLPKGENAEGG